MGEVPDPDVEKVLRDHAVWAELPADLEERILAELELPPAAED
jgi:hypothetical protein